MTYLRLLLWLAVCVLALGGCASGASVAEPPLPPIRPDTLGRLKVDGPNAFVNGVRVQTGRYVVDGDTVTTGDATSAMIVLNDGGEIQLDANTDPLIRQGVCLILEMVHGRVAFRNLKCQEFKDSRNTYGLARSFVNLEARADETRVTVLAGEVEMRSPTPATLTADMQYVVPRDGPAQVLQLTPEQAVATIAWTRNFFRPRPAQRAEGLSPAQASLIGGTIGLLVDRILKRDRGSAPPTRLPDLGTRQQDPQQQPQPQPQPQPYPPPEPEPQPARQPQPPQPPPQAEQQSQQQQPPSETEEEIRRKQSGQLKLN